MNRASELVEGHASGRPQATAESGYEVRRIFGEGEGGIYVAVGPTNDLGR